MARRSRKDDGSESANRDHNAKHRAQIVREVADNIISLEAQKSSIQEQITEERGRIKSLGIKAKIFNIALNLRRMEDEAERDNDLDGLRECFSALKIGGQLDWITATETEGQERDNPFAAAQGDRAGAAGKPFDSNPYPAGSLAHTSWADSWTAAQAKNAEQLGKGPLPTV